MPSSGLTFSSATHEAPTSCLYPRHQSGPDFGPLPCLPFVGFRHGGPAHESRPFHRPNSGRYPPSPKVRKQSAGLAATVRHGSASVPIYRINSGTRTRFAISWYRDGKRMRQVFRTIEAAKKEALVVARRVEAGTESLAAMATKYAKRFGSVASRATVPEVVEQVVASREQNGSGRRHLVQLGCVLRRFASACPGPILVWSAEQMASYERGIFRVPAVRRARIRIHNQLATQESGRRPVPPSPAMRLNLPSVPNNQKMSAVRQAALNVTSAEIDAWLRSLKVSLMSRNSMLFTVTVLFSCALEQNYLPAGQPTAASQLRKVKVPDSVIGIFTPEAFKVWPAQCTTGRVVERLRNGRSADSPPMVIGCDLPDEGVHCPSLDAAAPGSVVGRVLAAADRPPPVVELA
jgi:hypothetical protein